MGSVTVSERRSIVLMLNSFPRDRYSLLPRAANPRVHWMPRDIPISGQSKRVVRDATAGPRLAAGDGYLAALTNYTFLAHAVWMTEEAVLHIRRGA